MVTLVPIVSITSDIDNKPSPNTCCENRKAAKTCCTGGVLFQGDLLKLAAEKNNKQGRRRGREPICICKKYKLKGCRFEFHFLVAGSQSCLAPEETRSLCRCGPEGWAQLLCRDAADKWALFDSGEKDCNFDRLRLIWPT